MSEKLGFSTSKGFHNKAPFAENADSANVAHKITETPFTTYSADTALDYGVYLIRVTTGVGTGGHQNVFTAIVSVTSGVTYCNAPLGVSNTWFLCVRVGSDRVLTVRKYQVKIAQEGSADCILFDAGEQTEATTIEYRKII